MSKCRVCGGENGEHKPMDMMLVQSRYYSWLNAQDWKDILEFYKLVYLPFIHGIMERAEARQKEKLKYEKK